MNRIAQGLAYLAEQFSASRHEFCRDNQPQGAMLADGLVNNGYAKEKGDRLAVTDMGRKLLSASEQPLLDSDG